jgi:hypothetical protein
MAIRQAFAFTIFFRSSAKIDGFVNTPISALRFISLSLRRTESAPQSTRWFALANLTLQALSCFCLFGRWPNIQATCPAGGRQGARLELGLFKKPSRSDDASRAHQN